jgi:metal-responsive CopG/Arc/MetJ family transcriptional regulator
MKTIAITIDDDTLQRLDRVSGSGAGANRSRIIRDAVKDYLGRLERAVDDERETAILRRHRGRLARQAAVAVKAQGRP